MLFGTGGNSRSGSLYVISIKDLLDRRLQAARQIYKDENKGMLTPPALVDINGDKVLDIVIATFGSNVIAFNGKDYKVLWNVTFDNSESYSTLAVGYYDEDDIPDFLVKYQFGKKGYPVYEYEKTVVLSGKDGSKISRTLTDSIGSQSSPLAISGMFLHNSDLNSINSTSFYSQHDWKIQSLHCRSSCQNAENFQRNSKEF